VRHQRDVAERTLSASMSFCSASRSVFEALPAPAASILAITRATIAAIS
jgi:hypothetical protein